MGLPRSRALLARVARAAFADFGPPLLLAVPAAFAVASTALRASWATLGRDQGIFHYVAWAASRGEVLYRDVRDVNGPLVPLVHLFFLVLGGDDERRFRVVDLVVNALAFALAGSVLPDLGGKTVRRVVDRLAWAVSAFVVLMAQYLAFGWWDTAQRESFFDWFVVAAIASGIVAQRRMHEDQSFRGWVVACGAAACIPCFGKPTYALFTMAQLASLLADDVPVPRRQRMLAFAAGGALGASIPLSFLLLRGDPAAYARITFVDVPAMYRFIWPRTPGEIFALPGYDRAALLALATSAVVAALVARRTLPRRALPIAALPVIGLVSVVIQAKGFPYHFHPVSLGVSLALLAIAYGAWSRPRRTALRALAALLLLGIGIRARLSLSVAGFPPGPPSGVAAVRSFDAFERIDFFPAALRRAAEHVAAHTLPTDRVQTYGMDAYVLFLAQRRSATPYIYAYDLDVDAALGEGPNGMRSPSVEQAARIRAMRARHERDMLDRLTREPPAAFVFVGRSPLMTFADAVLDFEAHCPEAAAWFSEHYRESADFDGVRVFLRYDEGRRAE